MVVVKSQFLQLTEIGESGVSYRHNEVMMEMKNFHFTNIKELFSRELINEVVVKVQLLQTIKTSQASIAETSDAAMIEVNHTDFVPP